jgi:hypothetical protein
VADDPLALQSGGHFHHRRLRETHPAVADPEVQDGLVAPATRDDDDQWRSGVVRHWALDGADPRVP